MSLGSKFHVLEFQVEGGLLRLVRLIRTLAKVLAQTCVEIFSPRIYTDSHRLKKFVQIREIRGKEVLLQEVLLADQLDIHFQ